MAVDGMKTGSIVLGAIRRDLLRVFANFIDENSPIEEEKNLAKLVLSELFDKRYPLSKRALLDFEDLYCFLECLAPSGFYFGINPEDPLDYGFWEFHEIP